MSIVTMTSTVGDLQSGQNYRVRAKTAERLVAASQAVKANSKRAVAANEGKHH